MNVVGQTNGRNPSVETCLEPWLGSTHLEAKIKSGKSFIFYPKISYFFKYFFESFLKSNLNLFLFI